MAEERTFSAKQVATRIGTDAKQLRKFFRDPDSGYDAVGQGGRYDFPEGDIQKIAEAFKTWSSGKTTRNRPTRTAKAADAADAAAVPAPRRGRVKPGNLYEETLGQDSPLECLAGLPARMERHGLMKTMDGRIVRKPEKVLNPYPPKESIPGLVSVGTRGDDNHDSDEITED